MTRFIRRPLPLALLLLAFGLRLYRLGAESLWYDETVSVYLARLPIPIMLSHTAGDIHPPGYYLLLHGWNLLTHPSLAHGLEFLFAWPSLSISMITVALIYALGRRLLGEQVALLALLFAALDPFQIWYGQEVRMYTLGAALGLLCLWATVLALTRPRGWRWLIVYAAAAAAGLYTLYYFAFLLLALNIVALYLHNSQFTIHDSQLQETVPTGDGRGVKLSAWFGAQAGALLLWLPWLPIFWRQAVDPPVPPWRTPWPDLAAFAQSMGEALAAFVVGQSPPLTTAWPWALLAVTLTVAFAIRQRRAAGMVVLLYMAVPLALIVGLTLFFTPIYHVRYLSFVAAPFALVSASVVFDLWHWRTWAGGALVGLLVIGAGASLAEFWTNPAYAADDHRGAVAEFAARWRPGDAILANAGWVYPILLAYWPTDAADSGSTPPPIAQVVRIGDDMEPDDAPIIVRTGSMDGDPGLGWGDPASDFFASSAVDTAAGLQQLAETRPRLWHYRLYDTVSDPDGVIRAWLAAETDALGERQIPGRDYGMVQLFASRSMTSTAAASAWQPDGTVFGDALKLVQVAAPAAHPAGQYLYVNLLWAPQSGLSDRPADLSMSLRLYDSSGNLAAQQDEAPQPPVRTWADGPPRVQALALPIVGATPPGNYSLELVVYRQDNGEPLAVPESERSVYGQRYRLGVVEIVAR